MSWTGVLREGVSAVCDAFAADQGLRRACLVWMSSFALLGLLGVAMRLIGAAKMLDPALIGFFMPGQEWSLPSIFGYLTALFAAAALFAGYRRSGRFGYLAWAAVLLAICLDDAFEYHETVGALIAAEFAMGSIHRLRGQDVGEVIAWGLMGIVILPAMASALRTTDRVARNVHAVFFMLFGALLFFAVGLDIIHVLGPRALQPLLGLLEDGGEIMTLGLMAAAAWAFVGRERGATLRDMLRLPAEPEPGSEEMVAPPTAKS